MSDVTFPAWERCGVRMRRTGEIPIALTETKFPHSFVLCGLILSADDLSYVLALAFILKPLTSMVQAVTIRPLLLHGPS